MPRRIGKYTTLLMATGLTFGSISALFGYIHEYINQSQYTVLVTVVILSVILPTLVAQTFFRPRIELGETSEAISLPALGEEREVAGALDE